MQKVHMLAAWGEKDKMEFMTFTQRGEYLAGRDTLIKIQFGLDLRTSGVDPATAKAYESFLTGEILINKTDLAFLRMTNGNPEGKRTLREQFLDNAHRVKRDTTN